MTHNSESGFTLIEIMIALVILAIGLFSLATMQISFAQGNANSRQLVHATDIAMGKFEELGNITNSGHADLNPANNPHTETVTTYPIDYEIEWNVYDEGDTWSTIELTVSWAGKGRDHQVSFLWAKDL